MRSLAIPIIAMVFVIVTSNILVQYPINDWITWGAFTYPAVFLVADLTNRIFGLRQARIVAIIGFPFGILLSVILSTEADLGLWTSIRIALASGFAFILAQFLDIWIFDKLRKMTWWRAPLISSTLASAIDTTIFFAAAFAGSGLPWITWGLGDFGVKVGMAIIMLIPFKVFLALFATSVNQNTVR